MKSTRQGRPQIQSPTSNTQRPTGGRGSNLQLSTLNSQPTFEDVSRLLDHKHHEDPFDDFARQPLLPNRLSQLGPGVAWFDLNGDGREELLIGSGKGGNLAVYLNDGQGGFSKVDTGIWAQTVTRDQT